MIDSRATALVDQAERQRDAILRDVFPKLGALPKSANRQGRRHLLRLTKNLSRQEKEGVFTYVVSRYWTGPLTPAEKAFQAACLAELPENAVWYHGGLAGRTLGEELLPPSMTGADPRGVGASIPDRLKWVYFTPEIMLARAYATKCPDGGQVYVVQPQGEVCIDPIDLRVAMLLGDDCLERSTGYCSTKATVLEPL